MSIKPHSYEYHKELSIRTIDNKDLVVLSGIARLTFKGAGDMVEDDIHISVGPNWENIDEVIPNVALASISYDRTVYNALWSVNNCRWEKSNKKILLKSTLAIRGTESFINRLSYYVTAIGNLENSK
jgi:hypothetical protein